MLGTLDLARNRLYHTRDSDLKELFRPLIHLLYLDIRENQLDITPLPGDTFDALTNLEELILSGNNLQKLDKGLFRNLKNLTYLNLSYNNITSLENGLFQNLQKT